MMAPVYPHGVEPLPTKNVRYKAQPSKKTDGSFHFESMQLPIAQESATKIAVAALASVAAVPLVAIPFKVVLRDMVKPPAALKRLGGNRTRCDWQ
jgi:hypothetical protein